ncbi:outer envelope pore protein 37, chloroplastic [Cynara cardunculus var. scolymus]|uniref:outer envelope pore protein 37, chloroplastic n=1 Tax=Cynara cardunculus var. scolymus TaxID=59895 RepID=UPI000D62DD80|nr:outer envelope pore protein 37, chloroplastic [Cynara cardunculus var. scolymus]
MSESVIDFKALYSKKKLYDSAFLLPAKCDINKVISAEETDNRDMLESVSSDPSSLIPSTAADSIQPQPSASSRRPSIRVTTEFDSDTSLFFHKVSCKLFHNLAKLKLCFQNNNEGHVSHPQLTFTSKHLSCRYDLHEYNALLNGSFEIAPGLQLTAAHDVKAQLGEVTMAADLAPACKLELTSPFPSVGLPKTTLRFPFGEVSLEENEDLEEEDASPKLSVSGIFKGQVLNGICNAQYRDDNLNLRYSYKDELTTFIPSISLPSNALSFSFKRRFGPSDKLSYSYYFDTNCWSAVYKHTIGKEYKVKAGYDSEVQLGWASMWVGEEDGKAKTAPMKMKVQLMLQVPQDDVRSSALMFRVKKRWDI